MLDISLIIGSAITVLLIVSEALPFVRSNDYNGLAHFLLTKIRASSAPAVAPRTGR